MIYCTPVPSLGDLGQKREYSQHVLYVSKFLVRYFCVLTTDMHWNFVQPSVITIVLFKQFSYLFIYLLVNKIDMGF